MLSKTFIFLIFILFSPLSAFASEITVAGAANVQFTLDDLKSEFTKETGIAVKTVIGSSGSLTTQIENGAPFDVFLSADMEYPARLYHDGFSSKLPMVYAYGSLVLWTMKDIDLSTGMNVLIESAIKKIALANPQVAPYGHQAVNALRHEQLYDQVLMKFVLGESIAQANQFITTGAADIGFTAKSVVVAPNMKGHGKWVEVDPKSYDPIAQGVIVLKYGQVNHSREVQQFYDFLFSGSAGQILKKYGYNLP